MVVVSNGNDDTSNLQCAIDEASALGPGATVQLLGGTYKTAQLVIGHLHGALRGMGFDRTRLQNLDTPLPIDNPDSFAADPPGDRNRYPSLISVLGADVVLSDLTIVIAGDHPVSPWMFGGQTQLTLMANAVQVIGSGASLGVERVGISASGCSPEGNIGNGISMWTFGTPGYLAAASLRVEESLFNACGGVAVQSVHGGLVSIIGNAFDVGAAASAVYLGDVQDSRVDIESNRFSGGQAGLVAWGSAGGRGLSSTAIAVRGNALSGVTGVVLRGNWTSPIDCAIVGNNVRRTQVGYVLLPQSFGCAIVGSGPSTALDLTDGQHLLVGVQPAASASRELLDLLRSLR
jgi:hypothetical protein